MPACGTVTTSPACKGILFRVSPCSSSSFRLIVIIFVGGAVVPGEPVGLAEFVEFAGGAGFCAVSEAEGNALGFGFDVVSLSFKPGASSVEETAEDATPGGAGEIGSGLGTMTKMA